MNWRPDEDPDPRDWLALEPSERVARVRRWHEENPEPAFHREQQNLLLHAGMHAAIENQLAAEDPPVVRETLNRLMADGLRRHPAIHAIMRIFVEQMHAAMIAQRPFDSEAYGQRLRGMRPEDSIDVQGLARMYPENADHAGDTSDPD